MLVIGRAMDEVEVYDEPGSLLFQAILRLLVEVKELLILKNEVSPLPTEEHPR